MRLMPKIVEHMKIGITIDNELILALLSDKILRIIFTSGKYGCLGLTIFYEV